MITIEEITSVAGAEFDNLFSASLPYMEGGTFDWAFVGSPDSDAEKLEAVRGRFQELIDLPNTKCVLWRKDGLAISVAVGSINAGDEDYITYVAVLYGPDANGSRSWLYDETFIALTKAYFLENWDVLGYKASCINDSSVMRYHLNKPNAGAYYEVTVDSVEEKGGAQIATIRYRYL